jgi:uncharacterized protein (TIGR03083 family)
VTTFSIDDVADAFGETLDACPPGQLTACAGWTVNDIVVHLVSGAEEILRHVQPAIDESPIPPTRSFAERERPWRDRSDSEVRTAFRPLLDQVTTGLQELLTKQPDHVMPWTGRQMPSRMFLSHLRNELALHRWDLVGDDAAGRTLLSDPGLTAHTVAALAGPLLARSVHVEPGFVARLRSEGFDDVALRSSDGGVVSMSIAPAEGAATIEADPDVRLLLLWNRVDPSRRGATAIHRDDAAIVRSMLQGY